MDGVVNSSIMGGSANEDGGLARMEGRQEDMEVMFLSESSGGVGKRT